MRMSPYCRGAVRRPRLHDTATGELVLAARARSPRCTPAASPRTTRRTSGTPPPTPPGTCWSGPGWTRPRRTTVPEFRTLRTPGRPRRYTVIYVQNVTDVDDPLLERAARDGEDWRELAGREINRYRGTWRRCGSCRPPSWSARSRRCGVIERFSARLADRGALYNVDEDVYFAGGRPRLRLAVRARHGLRVRPGRDGRARRAARRRPGPPGQEGSAGRPGLAGGAARRAGLGLAVRAGQARLARRVRRDRHRVPGTTVFDVQAGGSDLVFPHHEMSASHARVALAPPARSPGCTCTPGWSATTARRCPSRWATWCS